MGNSKTLDVTCVLTVDNSKCKQIKTQIKTEMGKIRVECCLSHVCCLRDTTLGGNTMIQKEKEQVDQTALCLAEVEWPCCFKKHTKKKKKL